MGAAHPSSLSEGRLHSRVTSLLARRVIDSDRSGSIITFPKEADLCLELGVSRTSLREAMKVLVDKGMVEMKPKAGTRSRPRLAWRLLDPDILGWQAEMGADAQFLRDLCEVRLAIEPTAAGFAAVRASDEQLARIEACLEERRKLGVSAKVERVIELDLGFQSAVVEASHNPLLVQLSASIREPFRVALTCASRFPAAVRLGLEAHEVLVDSLRRRDPLGARRAAEEVVGFAMLAVEKQTREAMQKSKRGTR
jgi:GntR family transcriptional regulator, galactonate operon transcriptional repressor